MFLQANRIDTLIEPDAAELRVRPRAVVEAIGSYSVSAPPDKIELRLDANEGAPPTPAVLEAIGSILPERLRRYPDSRKVEALLARRLGCSPRDVIVTGGADDAIDRCCRAVLEPGRRLVLPVPTFEMIHRSARVAGAEVIEVEWSGGFPVEAILEAVDERTAMVAIVSPNNPTGSVAPEEAIRQIARATPHALVMVDLAYVEFADADITAAVLEEPNVVAVRTFSKAFGLAGLRLGYAVGRHRVVEWLRAVGGPYPTSGPSLAAAEAVLRAGLSIDGTYMGRIREEREILRRLLVGLGFDAPASEANFVFARRKDAAAVQASLRRRGIAVRAFSGMRRLDDALRITCPGNERDFERLVGDLRAVVEALKEVKP